eukprot:scaffold2663_cov353-Prasinococcus_capsulatus_cf.AAC.3
MGVKSRSCRADLVLRAGCACQVAAALLDGARRPVEEVSRHPISPPARVGAPAGNETPSPTCTGRTSERRPSGRCGSPQPPHCGALLRLQMGGLSLAVAGELIQPSLPATHGFAGVLASEDGGYTWQPEGRIQDADTWLIENTLAQLPQSRSLLMLFRVIYLVAHPVAEYVSPSLSCRTATGLIYQSTSVDEGKTWTRARPTVLPNPNSKICLVTTTPPAPHANRLILAYNHSSSLRTPLSIAAYDEPTGALCQSPETFV